MSTSNLVFLLDMVSSVTSVVVAIATVITLILMYRQLKEMIKQTQSLEKSINAATYQALIDAERGLWDSLQQDKQFLAEFVENITSRAPSVRPQTLRNIVTLLAFLENLYYQTEQGTLPAKMWPHWVSYLRRVVVKPMFVQVWPHVHDIFYVDFAQFLDKLAAEEQAITGSGDGIGGKEPAETRS